MSCSLRPLHHGVICPEHECLPVALNLRLRSSLGLLDQTGVELQLPVVALAAYNALSAAVVELQSAGWTDGNPALLLYSGLVSCLAILHADGPVDIRDSGVVGRGRERSIRAHRRHRGATDLGPEDPSGPVAGELLDVGNGNRCFGCTAGGAPSDTDGDHDGQRNVSYHDASSGRTSRLRALCSRGRRRPFCFTRNLAVERASCFRIGLNASISNEAAGTGGEAAIPFVWADHHQGCPLTTARDADSELGTVQSDHERALHGRLDDLTGQHGPGRGRAVHFELRAAQGGLHRHGLLAIEELRLACTSRSGHGDHKQQETITFHGCLLPVSVFSQRGPPVGSGGPRRSTPHLAIAALAASILAFTASRLKLAG